MKFYLLGLVIALYSVAVRAETLSEQTKQISERHENCMHVIRLHDERINNFGKKDTCSSALKTFSKYLNK